MRNNIAESSLQEITSVIFHMLNRAETKMQPIITAAEEIINSAKIIGININNYSAFHQFSPSGILGYKIGEILYLRTIEKNLSVTKGEHSKYLKGYLWYSKEGFFITNNQNVIIDTCVNLNQTIADKSVYCGSPNGLLNVKQYWLSCAGPKYLPLGSAPINAINIPEDFYSFDLFTLSAYSIILNAYKEADIDWLNYRLCALISRLYNENKTNQIRELYLFLNRIIYDPDLNNIMRLGKARTAFDYDTYLQLTPPMDQVISKILYKHINTAVKNAEPTPVEQEDILHGWNYYRNNFNDESGFSVNPGDLQEHDLFSKQFKKTLFVKDALAELCASIPNSEVKINIFFNAIEERKDFSPIEKIFEGIEKIKNSAEYKRLAGEKQEHYEMLREKIPSNLNNWLKTESNMISTIDSANIDTIYSRLIADMSGDIFAEIFG